MYILEPWIAGVDVILDVVGAPYLNKNLEALALDGRIFIIGLQGGANGEVNLGLLMAKRATIAGNIFNSPSCLHFVCDYKTLCHSKCILFYFSGFCGSKVAANRKSVVSS
jgi:D-arabinose 1-dehydrogenase-like Zn-dependent alcohol dehydrogenase